MTFFVLFPFKFTNSFCVFLVSAYIIQQTPQIKRSDTEKTHDHANKSNEFLSKGNF
jgi:hypothetical protein